MVASTSYAAISVTEYEARCSTYEAERILIRSGLDETHDISILHPAETIEKGGGIEKTQRTVGYSHVETTVYNVSGRSEAVLPNTRNYQASDLTTGGFARVPFLTLVLISGVDVTVRD